MHLADARRAGNDGGDVGIFQAPRERELRDRAAEITCDGAQFFDCRDLRTVDHTLGNPFVAFERGARVCRNAVLIFAGEQARRQRTPRGETKTDVSVKPRKFLLHFGAREEVVLRLIHHRFVQMMTLGDLKRGADFVSRPFAGAPVHHLALRDHVAHRAHGLFNRRVRVGAVTEREIHVVQLQAFQRAVDRLHQILAVQCVFLVWAIVQAPIKLGRDHRLRAPPAELLDGFAHDRLRRALSVSLSVVEEVDACVPCSGHAFDSGFGVNLRAIGDPRSVREFRDFKAGVA